MQKKDWLTVPNLLSCLRLLMIPVYVYCYLTAGKRADHSYYMAAVAVLALSAVTDFLDGLIARRCNMVSRLGKALDPIADKCTQGVVILCLGVRYPVMWGLFALFAVKEGFMLAMGLFHLKRGKMPSGALMIGKICTTVLFVSMIALMLFPALSDRTVTLIAAVCAVFMVLSLGMYAAAFFGKNNGYLQSIK